MITQKNLYYTHACNYKPYPLDGHMCFLSPAHTAKTLSCTSRPTKNAKQTGAAPHLPILMVTKDIPSAVVL